jgi:hypothetical protein
MKEGVLKVIVFGTPSFFYSPTFHLSQLFSSLLSVKDIKTKGAKIIPLGGVTIDKEIDWLFRNFCPSNGTCSV